MSNSRASGLLLSAAVLLTMAAPQAAIAQRAHARVNLEVLPSAATHEVDAPRVANAGAGFVEYSTRIHVSANTRYSVAVAMQDVPRGIDVQVLGRDGAYRSLAGRPAVLLRAGAPMDVAPDEVRYRVVGRPSAEPVMVDLVVTHS